jgi:hypothetical protein
LSILGFKSFSYVKFDYDTFKICRIQTIHERISLFGLIKNNKKILGCVVRQRSYVLEILVFTVKIVSDKKLIDISNRRYLHNKSVKYNILYEYYK